jgi:hypothetical protein
MNTTLSAQNLIEGANKSLVYKNGSQINSELQISATETISINFTLKGVELNYNNSKIIQNILNIEETDDWTILQVCAYDFDKNNINELIIAYDDMSINLNINIFNRNNGKYSSIGVFEGQAKCILEKNQFIMPYGSQGLFEQYTFRLGAIYKSN